MAIVMAQDVSLLVAVAIFIVPWIVASMLVRRLFLRNEISLKEDLHRSLIRGLSIIPVETLRRFLKRRDPTSLLDVSRFMDGKSELCIKVSEGLCSGYWICRGPPGQFTRPKDSDLVVLWFHGGAYCLGDPLGEAVNLLRIAEYLADHNVKASIFSVDYTLAPFAVYPHQQEEAIAAYRYLLQKEGIEPSRICIAGESAGGHLALSFLLALRDANLPKPRGALLLCPWINLMDESPSFKRNKDRDALNKNLLDRAVNLLVPRDSDGKLPVVAAVNLTRPLTGGRTWKQVLPAYSWINIGGHDILLDDATQFVHQARLDGAVVDLEVTKGKPHGWHLTANKASETGYKNLTPNELVPEGIMPGSELIAKAFLEILEKSESRL
ncbi:hypothetical protein N7456_013334 [Penicillium angulare]|uniref:Alpha/beta hydrolase fold-3 domain-containing protein n=1 Tax=Penicillium angulare TaxID=116970 RepID=A0A9W9EG09_9EURO|nr:hypothetical protein N7456_013334 [Penicillium angulare]